MGPTTLAKWLDVSERTIRAWAGEFSDFLSPQAVGGDGRHRSFSALDQRVMAHIARLRNENVPTEEIHIALNDLQHDGWRDLPPMPASANPDDEPVQMMPRETAERVLYEQRAALLKEIQIHEQQIDRLLDDLHAEREAHTTTRDHLTGELLAKTDELAELRGRLATLDDTAQRERRLLLYLLAAAALAAIILLAVVVLLALGVG